MAFKMKGFSAFTKLKEDKKKIKRTISPEQAKRINIENISACQNNNGQKCFVEVGDNEWYDPTEKDFIGSDSGSREWKGNYNDVNNKRDTMLVNPSYKAGDLIDETDWETGKATKKKKKK